MIDQIKNFILQFIYFHVLLVRFIYICSVASFKALLPSGILPKKNVKGEVVLITGAAQGLGRELARRFAELGARLILWDIDEDGLISLRGELEEKNVEVLIDKVDLSNKDEIRAHSRRALKDVHNIDILVLNAGMVNGKLLTELSEDAIERCMQVNALSHMFLLKHVLPSMVTANKGHIVSIASIAGFVTAHKMVDYCASKFAAIGIAEAVAEELRSCEIDAIKSTLVAPGFITTGLFNGFHLSNPILPPLSPEYVAERIMEAILTEADFVTMPRFNYLVIFFKGLLPRAAIELFNDHLGATNCMSKFVGRPKKEVIDLTNGKNHHE